MKKLISIIIIMIMIMSLTFSVNALTYQAWTNYPATPTDLESYPYQAILSYNPSNHTLFVSANKLYLQDGYIISSTAMRIYSLNTTTNTWTYSGANTMYNYGSQILSYCKEANNDIYASNLTTVLFGKTTDPPELPEMQKYPELPDSITYPYKLVYFHNDAPDTRILIESSVPAFVGSEFNSYIWYGFPMNASIKRWSHTGNVTTWSLYDEETFTSTNDHYDLIDKPLDNNILYINYTLMSADQNLAYLSDDDNWYNEFGFPNFEHNDPKFPTIETNIDYPYYIVYRSATDGQIRVIRSMFKLRLNAGNYSYEIMAFKPNTYERAVKLDNEWVTDIYPQSLIDDWVYIDSVTSKTNILAINYDLYYPDLSEKVYDEDSAPYDPDGQPVPDPVDPDTQYPEPDPSTSILDSIFNLLDRLNPNSPYFFMKSLFTYDKENYDVQVSSFKDAISQKLGFESFLDLFSNIAEISAINPDFTHTVNIYGVGEITATFVDRTIYDSFQTTINSFLRAILFVGMLIFNINQIFKFLTGGSAITDGAYREGDSKTQSAMDKSAGWRHKSR